MLELAGAVAELLGMARRPCPACQQQVVHRRFLGIADVAAALDLARAAAHHGGRQIVMRVHIAVADAAAVEDQGVVEQGAVAIRAWLSASPG